MDLNWKVRYSNWIWRGSCLGLIGVLVDPTTAGIGDSERAMSYVEPWVDDRENDDE